MPDIIPDEPDHLDEIDPQLKMTLAHLFNEYGPTGTVNVAIRMLNNLKIAEGKLAPTTRLLPPLLPRRTVADVDLPPTDV